MLKTIVVLMIVLFSSSFYLCQEDSAKVASQNPSPMQEFIRKHERIPGKILPGKRITLKDSTLKEISIFIPQKNEPEKKSSLLFLFHGPAFISEYAANHHKEQLIAVSISLGSGSKRYYGAFSKNDNFMHIIENIADTLRKEGFDNISSTNIIIAGFSAGYGAVKGIIEDSSNYKAVSKVILLDGIHASYIPDRKVIFEGGKIDSLALEPFLKLARRCSHENSSVKFIITHSEIFPGTFVSTTEATDYIISALGLTRKPVLKWGPLGMQQTGETVQNNFMTLAFAGNTAPDHVDHLHALYYFINL